MEELLEKYKGAYASDYEEPSASPETSEGTEDEEEEETEGDESDDASSGKVVNSFCFLFKRQEKNHQAKIEKKKK